MSTVHNGSHTATFLVQSLTFESWEFNMWSMIDAEHTASGLWFILVIVIGEFILVNVYVAGISAVYLSLRKEHAVIASMEAFRSGQTRQGFLARALSRSAMHTLIILVLKAVATKHHILIHSS